MKTKIFLLSLLILLFCASSCHKPPLPKPGEPTIDISQVEKPAWNLPWGVMKGTRLT